MIIFLNNYGESFKEMSLLEPTWNKSVKEYDRALDPLGLSRVNNRMVGDLLPGFTSMTQRAGYYVFYTWAIAQIRRKKLTKSLPQFKNAIYDLERLFMLSCIAHAETAPENNHAHITGMRKGRDSWNKNPDKIPLNIKFFGDKLGGYGQYYEKSMMHLGLAEWDEVDGYEKPTKLGLDMINHFTTLAVESGIMSQYGKKSISKSKLTEMGEKLCLCKLGEWDNDKNLLRNTFFGFSGTRNKSSKARQESFAMILSVIEQASTQNHKMTSQDFLDSVYFGGIQTVNDSIRIIIPPSLAELSKKWKIVKAHDNLAFATESILQSFLGILEMNHPKGLPLEDFFKIIFENFDAELGNLLNRQNENRHNMTVRDMISDILNGSEIVCDWNDISGTSKKFDTTISLSSEISEKSFVTNLEGLLIDQSQNPCKISVNGILLVLFTALRMSWRMNPNDSSAVWLKQFQESDIGILEFTDFVREHVKQNISVVGFTREFILKYVILQAEKIYRDKINPNSNPKQWFHKSGSNYVRDRDYIAGPRSIRFESTLSILHDLGVVNSTDDILECTESGRKMLGRVLGTV